MPSYYNQDVIINKLNRYLSLNKRHLKLKTGYCHGFTLLWLYKMSTGQEAWFYKTIRNIAACKSKADFAEIEMDIEKFLSHIEWLQNSDKYVTNIHQLDVDKVMELPRELSLSLLFNSDKLNHLLETVIQENKMICLSGPNHTIGVFRKNGKNYIFDPNYNRGRPRIIDDIEKLKAEIIRCIFQQENLGDKKIPLEVNITSDPMDIVDQDEGTATTSEANQGKIEMYDELLDDEDNIDEPGYAGITNLYLACESGDEDEVTRLLEKGADPNQICNTDWTPLLVAADKGYTSTARILLENGAKVNLGDKNNLTPLYLAAEAGNTETVRLLLSYGAQPTLASNRKYTPIFAALDNQKWDAVVYMLLHCNHTLHDRIRPKDLDELRKYRLNILEAAQSILPGLRAEEQRHLENLLKRLLNCRLTSSIFATASGKNKRTGPHQETDTYHLRSRV